MEYSVKTPIEVAQMVENVIKDTREGHHKVTVKLLIEDGEIKALDIT